MDDREVLLRVSLVLTELHNESAVAQSPTARMVLRRIAYILHGTPPSVSALIEQFMAKGSGQVDNSSGPKQSEEDGG